MQSAKYDIGLEYKRTEHYENKWKENRAFQEFPMNAVRLCIDRYKADVQGRIYSRMSAKPLIFSNCSEMLLRTDALFDERGYPQTFQEKRSFQEGKRNAGRYAVPHSFLESQEIWRQRGECQTLDIIVQSRRQAGWQGLLLYSDGRMAAQFKSELELLESIGRELDVIETINIDR